MLNFYRSTGFGIDPFGLDPTCSQISKMAFFCSKKKTITNKCYGFCTEPAEGLEPTTC